MNYFCDIKVLPDPEASEPVLISNLMAKLHRTLVLLRDENIGISFPYVNKTLGNTLRLHGSEQSINTLFGMNWLKGLRDYCLVGDISAVPKNCQHRTVKRKQAKSVHNKRQRSIAKGWLSPDEAVVKISLDQQRLLCLPFVQLKSTSTGQNMKLFIEHGELTNDPIKGNFSRYGLSATSTIPWF
jgi:CRISPR-associated endonuclease Csy4